MTVLECNYQVVGGKCRVYHLQVQLEARTRRPNALPFGGTEAAELVGISVKRSFDCGDSAKNCHGVSSSPRHDHSFGPVCISFLRLFLGL